MKWVPINGYAHPLATGGRATYCPKDDVDPLPASILLRESGSRRRPLPFRTEARSSGGDDDLQFASDDLTKILGRSAGLETVELGWKRANPLTRFWYTPNLVLSTVLAIVSWLATISAAVFAYVAFLIDQSNAATSTGGQTNSGTGNGTEILYFAVVVLVLAAIGATVKLIADLRQK